MFHHSFLLLVNKPVLT